MTSQATNEGQAPYAEYLGRWIHQRRHEITEQWLADIERKLPPDPRAVALHELYASSVPEIVSRIASEVAGVQQGETDDSGRDPLTAILHARRRDGVPIRRLLRKYAVLWDVIHEEAVKATVAREEPSDPVQVATAIGRLAVAVRRLSDRTAQSFRDYALRYDRERTELLTAYGEMLSHELGNRLGAAETGIRLLRSGMDVSQEQRDRLENLILESIQRGLETVQDVRALDAPNGAPQGDGQISLSMVVKESVRQAKVRASSRNIKLYLTGDVPEVRVPGGPIRLILSNLLGNALKYHRTEGDDRWVRLAAEADANEVTIRVEDNGPGIPEGERKVIFEYRYRGDVEESGTGLGLAIANDATIAMGGQIWVEEGSEGGARFAFTCPIEG